MKIRKSLSYPGHNVKIFINWYKAIMEKFEKIKHSKNVMVINYENFILQHAKEKKKLLNFIGLKNNTKFKYDIKTSEQNIFKAKKYLLKYELNIIEKKLKKFLQWPKRN